MAYTTLNSLLTAIANAIRAKKGTTAQINAQNFPSEIASISTSLDVLGGTFNPNHNEVLCTLTGTNPFKALFTTYTVSSPSDTVFSVDYYVEYSDDNSIWTKALSWHSQYISKNRAIVVVTSSKHMYWRLRVTVGNKTGTATYTGIKYDIDGLEEIFTVQGYTSPTA